MLRKRSNGAKEKVLRKRCSGKGSKGKGAKEKVLRDRC